MSQVESTVASVRDAVIQLLREIPAEKAVYRTMSRTFLVGDMADLLEARDDAAGMWLSDSFRTVRYLVGREMPSARKMKKRDSNEPVFPPASKIQSQALFVSLLKEVQPEEVVYSTAKCRYTASAMLVKMAEKSPDAEAWMDKMLTTMRNGIVDEVNRNPKYRG